MSDDDQNEADVDMEEYARVYNEITMSIGADLTKRIEDSGADQTMILAVCEGLSTYALATLVSTGADEEELFNVFVRHVRSNLREVVTKMEAGDAS